jgi:RimJ/RimL family protein N-acetyltransferase
MISSAMENLSQHSPAGPIIETARLRMRPHRLDDFRPCAAMWADPLVTRYIGGRPFTEEEVWARLLRYAGLWALLGFGFWAVLEKSTGEFVGDIGFADFKRDLSPPLDLPEMGWVLAARAHGKGYATEAVRAALAWADAHFKSSGTVCIIDVGNLPSLGVAAKAGYRELRRTTYKDKPLIVFERSSVDSSSEG